MWVRGSNKDLPKTVDVDELTIRETDWGDIHVSLITCHRKLDIAPLLKGLPDDLCQCPHWGYLVKGKALLRLADGEEIIINGGDLYYCPPGHKLYALEDFENIEFNPAAEAKMTLERFTANIPADG